MVIINKPKLHALYEWQENVPSKPKLITCFFKSEIKTQVSLWKYISRLKSKFSQFPTDILLLEIEEDIIIY